MSTLPQLYRWSRAEYDQLIEQGVFECAHVELIGGRIVEMSPKGPRHMALTNLVRKALERIFPADRFTVRPEGPLALGAWDEPEPDVAVVRGRDHDYLAAHPTAEQTVLVVEVAVTTAAYDLGYKADMYAAAGITDYWVVEVEAGQVAVLRAPRPEAGSETGQRYSERTDYRVGDLIAPLVAEARPVPASELLP